MSQANEHDVPFFYDFLLDGNVSAHDAPGVLKTLETKIQSARRFLDYLNQLSPEQGKEAKIPEGYSKLQHELSTPIVDGALFLTLNAEFNHAAFEREDTAANQRRLQQELEQATKVAEEEKNKFKQAVKNLEEKAAKIDGADLAQIDISKKGQDFLFHFDKVCRWVLDIYYDTPPSKYDWENFREQAFTSDNGADLRNRVKGIHIPKLFDYQIETGKYVLSTRKLFQTEVGSKSWDVVISTVEDISAAFDAREKYTKAKKLISDNKIKIIQATIDLTQGETIAKTSGPLIHTIMDELVVRDNNIRLINLSDFQEKNQAQHSFHKDSSGKKINNFLREDALANYGATKGDSGKEGKKGGKGAKPAAPAEPQPPKQPEAPVEVAPPPEKLEDINMGMLD